MTYSGLFAQTTFTQLTQSPAAAAPGDSRSVHVVDIDMDGFDDLYITNGPSGGAPDFMYFNNGLGILNPFLGGAPVQASLSSVGATVADADNNGQNDIFLTTWYGQDNQLYLRGALGQYNTLSFLGGSYSEAAAWGDYNNDGLLDLYVSNSAGNLRNKLYINQGDLGFPPPFLLLDPVDAGDATDDQAPSRGVSWIDYDNDGDLDIFVCNEENMPNALYRNNGDGTFTRILEAGDLFALDRGSMSASWGDINNDGRPDLFIANAGYFQPQANQMFINNGDGTFTAHSGPWDTDGGCSYSSSFADYDCDGDLDLVVTNGFCGGQIVNFLYLNDGQGNFTKDETSIPDLNTPCSFGAAWGDLNHDGYPDLVIATCRNTAQSPLPVNLLWRNDGNGNNWLKVRTIGVYSNAGGVGARLRLKTVINGQAVRQMRDISAQTGYCSQNSLTAHFGLGDAEQADSLIIEWPSGMIQYFTDVAAGQTLIAIEETPSSLKDAADPAPDWKLYPNPVADRLGIRGHFPRGAAPLEMSILDINGRRHWNRSISELPEGVWEERIDLTGQNLPSGAYILQLRSALWQDSKVFVVAR